MVAESEAARRDKVHIINGRHGNIRWDAESKVTRHDKKIPTLNVICGNNRWMQNQNLPGKLKNLDNNCRVRKY